MKVAQSPVLPSGAKQGGVNPAGQVIPPDTLVMLALLTTLSERVTLLRIAACSLQTRYPVLTWTSSADPVDTRPAWQFLVTFNPEVSGGMLQVAVAILGAMVLPPGPVAVAVTVSVQPAPTHTDVGCVIDAP